MYAVRVDASAIRACISSRELTFGNGESGLATSEKLAQWSPALGYVVDE